MNPKIFVGVAIAALAATIGVVLLSGPSIVNQATNEIGEAPSVSQITPLSVELDGITISEINERAATIEIKFKIFNPNPTSAIVQVMDYQLYETDYSEVQQVSGGQIGSRPQGMVEFGSNYYTLLGNSEIVLKDKVVLQNTGNTPELWSSLESNTATWKVTGDVFFNLSSMTSGQENELHFEFTQ